ncbi:hypothetical protein V865_005845 [Kwoniella europaea PYCC6329]|uniref:Uncharacterized protein n=1 Tax=Kwoniella europaea PYCC6329 TaxID=1423913 RepID=A0AAX4KPZ0_9TREE
MSSGAGSTKRARDASSRTPKSASQAKLGDDLHPKPHSDSSRASSVARSHAGAALEEFCDFGDDTGPGFGGVTPEFSFDLGGGDPEPHTSGDTAIATTATSPSALGLRETADTAFLGYTAPEGEDTLTAIRSDVGQERDDAPTDHPVAIRALGEYEKKIADSSRRSVLKASIKSFLLMYTEQQLTCKANHRLMGQEGCVPGAFTSHCHDLLNKKQSKYFLDYLDQYMDDHMDTQTMQFSEDTVNNTDDVTDNNDICRRKVQSTREALYPYFRDHGAFIYDLIDENPDVRKAIQLSLREFTGGHGNQAAKPASSRGSQGAFNEDLGEGSSTGISRR